ncbi:MAG TPA: NAD(P)/FAD-dependent oxidoreductase [Mycobacteriales bacterium]|jgi:Dehydrogenases (flavoproteins)
MHGTCTSTSDTVDVVVIGAGPAGATAALTLARHGRSVTVLEQRRFPRFHIGESLLPYMVGMLDQLGILDHVRGQGYVVKRGAEFTDHTGAFRRVNFTAQGPGRYHDTFQVERAHFDRLLVECARDAGATIVEDAHVAELVTDNGRVSGVAYTEDGVRRVVRARFVVDAAGRSSRMAQTFGLRRMMENLRMVAVFRHFTGLDESQNPGEEGDIQIGSHPDGWVWAIPIWSDTISIGVVMPKALLRSSQPERLYDEHLGRIARITQRLRGSHPLPQLRVETDYCYFSDQVTGPGWMMVGDSGCFVDPIFSGGVYLAMVTGSRAADALHQVLADPAAEGELFSGYESFYKTGYDTYARLVQAFYESNFDFNAYVRSLPEGIDRRWIARLLSGDFWSGHNPVSRSLRAEHRWDTFARFEPTFGCPVYGELDAAEQLPVVG